MREALSDACRLMEHRGPDDQGVFIDGYVGLGHRRLSIIDLSAAGHQPMANEDGTIWLTFNGEIYNYLELMGELKAKGHRFASGTDSEVVIHAYEEWGTECLNKFNGMWGFAIWDTLKQRLFLARDRFGVKPLYYARHGKSFYFASEIKAILSLSPDCAEADQKTLYRFLSLGVLDDRPQTFFRNVLSLPPAHFLLISDSHQTSPRRYWDLRPGETLYDRDDAHLAFRELLADSVKLRLRSDVPIGTCLSGGLDSSTIVALMDREIDQPIRTFTALYPEPGFDESKYAALINERFDTAPHAITPSFDDLPETLPKIVWHQDEPSGGPGLYSQWHVMQRAHGEVKVLLDGQGGDELLGGYVYYLDYYLASLIGKLAATRDPHWRHILMDALAAVRKQTGQSWGRRIGKLVAKKILDEAMTGSFDLPAKFLLPLNETARARYASLHPEFVGAARNKAFRPLVNAWSDPLDRKLYADLCVSSIPALLRYEDRNSMAFSIEARTPFLDYRLAEFCFSLPFAQKIDMADTKHILRRAMADLLPAEVVARTDKMGYPTPFVKWLRKTDCRLAKEILLSPEARQRKILAPAAIERSFDLHASGRADLSWEIWRWMTTELWFRQFIDKKIAMPVVSGRR